MYSTDMSRSGRHRTLGVVLISVIIAFSSSCGVLNAPRSRSEASPTNRPDLTNMTELDAKAESAILDATETGLRLPKKRVERIRFWNGLQHSCNADLPSDSRVVGRDWAGWSSAGKSPYLEQWSFAFDRPIGVNAVEEAKSALTCGTYDQQGVTYTVLKEDGVRDLEMKNGGRAFRYCESLRGYRGADFVSYVCIIVVGHDDVACNVQVQGPDLNVLRDLLTSIEPIVVAKCS